MKQTVTYDQTIQKAGRRALKMFVDRRSEAKALISSAAHHHNDTVDVYLSHGARYVAKGWNARFERSEAKGALIGALLFLAASVMIASMAGGAYALVANFWFTSFWPAFWAIVGAFALGLAAVLSALGLVAASLELPCLLCMAATFFIRGSTPYSDRTFKAHAEATWALGTKNLYLFTCQVHGFEPTVVRVVPYDQIRMISHPTQGDVSISLILDTYDFPNNVSSIVIPVASDARSGNQLCEEIIRRAANAGKEIEVRPPMEPLSGNETYLSPRHPGYCYMLRNRPSL